MSQYEIFLKLHKSAEPLLIGNTWDAGGAKLVEENGFKAIATSSAAIALSMGYEDGENIPFELMLRIVERIKSNISIPLSVDLERGYSDNINGTLQNIEKLHDIGVVGINIEDSNKDNQLLPAGLFEKTILSLADHLSKKNMSMFINARTDAFLLNLPDAVEESKKRISIYENAGAGGIFVPFIRNEADIKQVVEATTLPVNVLTVPQLPGIDRLTELGVKRISLGSTLYRSINKEIVKKVQAIKADRSFRALF